MYGVMKMFKGYIYKLNSGLVDLVGLFWCRVIYTIDLYGGIYFGSKGCLRLRNMVEGSVYSDI